jgi:hypothetical protein
MVHILYTITDKNTKNKTVPGKSTPLALHDQCTFLVNTYKEELPWRSLYDRERVAEVS